MSRPPKMKKFKAEWRGVQLQIDWTKNFLNTGMSHLEIRCIAPQGAILPLTETGYRSCFIEPEQVASIGSPVEYVLYWLNEAALSPEWQKHLEREAAARQLTLF